MTIRKKKKMEKSDRKTKRIAWTMAGEGRGHASRNLVLILEMSRRGYPIDIYTYDDSIDALKDYFQRNPKKEKGIKLIRIQGFQHHYDTQGKISFNDTIRKNLKPFYEGVKGFHDLVKTIKKGNYSLIVSDFEPFFTRAVKAAKVSAPHIQASAGQAAIAYGKLDVPQGMTKGQYRVYKQLVRHYQPKPDRILVETFFDPGKLSRRAQYVGAVLRPEIENAKITYKEFILVYMKPIIERLIFPIVDRIAEEKKRKFVVYTPTPDKFKPSSRYVTIKRASLSSGYIDDFASCSGMISTGGTEIAGECIWLEKPLLSVMQAMQYEQYVSGHYIRKAGLGTACVSTDLNEKRILKFLEDIPTFQKNLSAYKHNVPWGTKTIPDILEGYLR